MAEARAGTMLLCQSCGMPLAAAEHFGTNGDNTPSGEYCCFCYREGRFTDGLDLPGKVADSITYHDEGEKENGRTLTRNELSVRLHLLYPKLRRWASHDNTHTAYYEAVNRAVAYINENLSSKLSLKSVSDFSFISEFHFHRIFRAVMGEAPGEYIQRLRLEKAAFILSNSNTPLADVAAKCGYETQQALSRAFRRQFGVTPSAYRRSPVEARFGADQSANLGIEPVIVRREEMVISGIRVDNPLENDKAFVNAWDKLRRLTAGEIGPGTEYILLSNDCSTITRPERYNIYACVTPVVKSRSAVRFRIEGGLFAVFTHRGPYTQLGKLYCHIYRWWIPYGKYRLRDSRYFEKFLNDPADTAEQDLLTEVWIPVERQ